MANQAFFVPGSVGDDHEKAYRSIVAHIELIMAPVESDRIHSIDLTYSGRNIKEMVGQPSGINGEIVLAILRSGTVYYVCTANRGALRQEPMMHGLSETSAVAHFAPTP